MEWYKVFPYGDIPWYFKTCWGRVTRICIGNLTIVGSDDDLSPSRHQSIIWTNAGIMLIRTLGTNYSEILSESLTFTCKKMHFKIYLGTWRPFCLGFNMMKLLWTLWVAKPWLKGSCAECVGINRLRLATANTFYRVKTIPNSRHNDLIITSLVCFPKGWKGHHGV